jgi:hypothetical protein
MYQNYILDLLKIPLFQHLQKDILRRNARIAKEIEDEEKKIVAELRRKEKEERDEEKEVLRLKKEAENKIKRMQRDEEKASRAEEKERLEDEQLQLKVYNAIHFPPGSTIFAVPDKMKKHPPSRKNVIPLK